ncbi:hypothetical protein E3U55_14025 [Filobacillus milosensis]|uniref:Tyr recombinase domain-containing protein n=1 Tax=Filobacillus milosensis TaxID=94137 RepID=A0A4Y8IHW3_9BACI|nr:tyrosine-type recombinase/integrase [Filobacillus milosensis]TFB14293.1 hypothetical protein E3U55_14025 [Filobacillus milosensis]
MKCSIKKANGIYTVKLGRIYVRKTHRFKSKEQMLNFLSKQFEEPINSTEKINPLSNTWSKEEADKFMNIAKAKKQDLKYNIALDTGMRLLEIINLKWEDINFHDNTITVTYRKNNKERVVEISPEIVNSLINIQTNRINDNDYVFSTDGELPDPKVWSNQFAALTKEASVKNITFHGLRTTYIKQQLEHRFLNNKSLDIKGIPNYYKDAFLSLKNQ